MAQKKTIQSSYNWERFLCRRVSLNSFWKKLLTSEVESCFSESSENETIQRNGQSYKAIWLI